MKIIILALLFGGSAIAIGVMQQRQNHAQKQACTVQTSGLVVRIDEQTNTETYTDADEKDAQRRTKTKEVTWYYPVFEYSAGERTLTQTAKIGSGSPRFRVGAQVTVFYNPDKPDEYYVAEDTADKDLITILYIIGALILVGGFVMFFMR